VTALASIGVALGFVMFAGCTPKPARVACQTYVAGSFTGDNGYALTVDAAQWPTMVKPTEMIELTFLTLGAGGGNLELVHVQGSKEVERWTLQVPKLRDRLPVCRIAVDPALSTCGGRIRLLPHDVGGYYYLRAGNEIVEAAMTFLLCR
jgi:hypothetical protein